MIGDYEMDPMEILEVKTRWNRQNGMFMHAERTIFDTWYCVLACPQADILETHIYKTAGTCKAQATRFFRKMHKQGYR